MPTNSRLCVQVALHMAREIFRSADQENTCGVALRFSFAHPPSCRGRLQRREMEALLSRILVREAGRPKISLNSEQKATVDAAMIQHGSPPDGEAPALVPPEQVAMV